MSANISLSCSNKKFLSLQSSGELGALEAERNSRFLVPNLAALQNYYLAGLS